MTVLFTLSLDTDWTWRRNNAHGEETRIAQLAAWTPSEADTVTLVFSRTFDLEPLEVCARYWLYSDGLPGETTVLLRDEVVVRGVSGGLAVDVTDVVMLEENVLRLIVEALRPNMLFSKLWLEAVPCE